MGEMHSANGMGPNSANTPNSPGAYSSDNGSNGTHASDYKVRSSRLLKVVNWWHILTVYLPSIQLFLLLLFVGQVAYDYQHYHHNVKQQVEEVVVMAKSIHVVSLQLLAKVTPLIILVLWYLTHSKTNVYLVDFATFKAPESWKITHEQFMELMRRKKCFNDESLGFMEKILQNSGMGQSTAWPPGIIQMFDGKPAAVDTEAARDEAEQVLCGAVKDLLAKTKVNPKAVDILVINCSLFSPTPSLCAMVAEKFQMRSDLLTYNLSGMGCSAGLVSIDLAQRMLLQRPNSLALVLSTENLTQALYHGNDRAFLLQNTLFRCGGSAVLLSNKRKDGYRAKFKLLHLIRTQGTDENSYSAVYSTEDSKGIMGVRLSKDIVKVAGRLMEKNLTAMGPQILPMSEIIRAGATMGAKFLAKTLRKVLKAYGMSKLSEQIPEVKNYVPDFKRAVDHFCIHAGGRGVIDGVEKNLRLHPHHVEPSRMTLYEHGNTSSSSIWYELEYIEKHMNLKRGQRVLQVAFGSGFKCNSACWVSL